MNNLPIAVARILVHLAALLVALVARPFATTGTVGELCVNYVSRTTFGLESGKFAPTFALMSFNPRTRTSLVVAQIDDFPNGAWERGFGALIYGAMYWLEWKVGAVPALLPPQLGKDWNTLYWNDGADGVPPATFDAPAHRKILADGGGNSFSDTFHGFATPVIWLNTETGERKTLSDEPFPGTSPALQIATADNFILIAEESGHHTVVADMNTGEVLLRAGAFSHSPRWGECPAK